MAHPESRLTVTLVTTPTNNVLNHLLNRFSSLSKIIRIIGYCRRFKTHHHLTTILTPVEQNEALNIIIKSVQHKPISLLNTMAKILEKIIN
jgi:hypothetical protein